MSSVMPVDSPLISHGEFSLDDFGSKGFKNAHLRNVDLYKIVFEFEGNLVIDV